MPGESASSETQPPAEALPADRLVPPAENLTRTEFFVPFRNPRALAAYYCSIFSLVPGLGLILGPAAQILGTLALCQAVRQPELRGGRHAMAALAIGIVTSILNWSLLLGILIGLYLFGAPARPAEPDWL